MPADGPVRAGLVGPARVLAEHDAEVRPSTDVAVGAALADVPLGEHDFALAVVPAGRGDHNASLPAICIEIGVAAERDLPVLVIAEPPDQPSPALAGVTTVVTQTGNEEALRLWLSLFPRQVAASPRRLKLVGGQSQSGRQGIRPMSRPAGSPLRSSSSVGEP